MYTIPATGTYYVRAAQTTTPATRTGSYQFRLDLGRGIQLEPYDRNFANNNTSTRQRPELSGRAPRGTWWRRWRGSLYSQEGVDYYALGRLDPGNQVVVSSRTISVSGLTYKLQVVGGVVGLLPDADGSQHDSAGHRDDQPRPTTIT